MIVVEFNIDKPADEATNDVRDKVSSVILPNEVDKPMVEKYSISGSPIITLFISTKAPTQELMLFSNEQIKPLLQNVRGVGNVTVVGMRDRVIKIVPHATKLNEYGIDLNTFSKIISAQNVKSDGGRVIQPEFEWSISIDADAISVDDLKSIKIIDGVRLGDVADVFSDISDERT